MLLYCLTFHRWRHVFNMDKDLYQKDSPHGSAWPLVPFPLPCSHWALAGSRFMHAPDGLCSKSQLLNPQTSPALGISSTLWAFCHMDLVLELGEEPLVLPAGQWWPAELSLAAGRALSDRVQMPGCCWTWVLLVFKQQFHDWVTSFKHPGPGPLSTTPTGVVKAFNPSLAVFRKYEVCSVSIQC